MYHGAKLYVDGDEELSIVYAYSMEDSDLVLFNNWSEKRFSTTEVFAVVVTKAAVPKWMGHNPPGEQESGHSPLRLQSIHS